MKKLFCALIIFSSVILTGCGSSDEPPRNTRLDELKRVGGDQDFYLANDLQCRVLTATQASEKGTIFRLQNLMTTPTIGFAAEDFDPIKMEKTTEGTKLVGFLIFSNRYGESYLVFDMISGVFSLSSIDVLKDSSKSTLRGNCKPLELLES